MVKRKSLRKRTRTRTRTRKRSSRLRVRRRHSTYSSPRACSPISKADIRSNKFSTCYTYEALLDIAKAYNTSAPYDDRIKIVKGKKQLWKEIKDKMDRMSDCEGEWCWVKQPIVKNIDEKKRKNIEMLFKPPIPKGKYDWLSTEDIDNVINQYTELHPEFYFLGTWPMDFAKLSTKFSTFDPIKLQSIGKTKSALVLNEDTSNQPGSHWVGLFIDIPKREVNFFDSLGDQPMKPVSDWVRLINEKLILNRQKPFQLIWNPHRHQYANSECGVYTINFILNRLKDVPFKTIVNNQIRDEAMNKKRKQFFNPFDKYDNR